MSDRGISERLRRAFEDWRDRLPLSRDKKAFAGIMKERMKGRGGQKGVSYQTILAYFDGTYTPSLEWLNEAAAEFGVRLPWLALNEGPMTETLRERGRSAATAGNIDSLRLHVPSVHYNRGENAGGDYLNVGRLEADLLHHCSCAVHETMSAGGMLELAEGHIAQARRLLDILQERARGIARVLAMYRPADEAPANAKGENSP
jgi:hypothetical protein